MKTMSLKAALRVPDVVHGIRLAALAGTIKKGSNE